MSNRNRVAKMLFASKPKNTKLSVIGDLESLISESEAQIRVNNKTHTAVVDGLEFVAEAEVQLKVAEENLASAEKSLDVSANKIDTLMTASYNISKEMEKGLYRVGTSARELGISAKDIKGYAAASQAQKAIQESAEDLDLLLG
jgi:hypothetical protein